MLFIESIKCKEVGGNEVRLPHFGMSPGSAKGLAIQTEVLRGEEFMDSTGKTKRICMAPEVQEILGLPMEVFSDTNRTIMAMQRNEGRIISEMNGYRSCLADITDEVIGMTWLNRLKFLFTGSLDSVEP